MRPGAETLPLLDIYGSDRADYRERLVGHGQSLARLKEDAGPVEKRGRATPGVWLPRSGQARLRAAMRSVPQVGLRIVSGNDLTREEGRIKRLRRARLVWPPRPLLGAAEAGSPSYICRKTSPASTVTGYTLTLTSSG